MTRSLAGLAKDVSTKCIPEEKLVLGEKAYRCLCLLLVRRLHSSPLSRCGLGVLLRKLPYMSFWLMVSLFENLKHIYLLIDATFRMRNEHFASDTENCKSFWLTAASIR